MPYSLPHWRRSCRASFGVEQMEKSDAAKVSGLEDDFRNKQSEIL
jgi:hypothetical protein